MSQEPASQPQPATPPPPPPPPPPPADITGFITTVTVRGSRGPSERGTEVRVTEPHRDRAK